MVGLDVDPGVLILPHLEALAQPGPVLLVTQQSGGQGAPGIRSRLGDDVDHPVHRIGAPGGGARSADHLDALDILQHQILGLPDHPGVKGRIDTASIDHHQQLVGETIIEATSADRPLGFIQPRHVEPWHHTQQFRQPGGGGASDILGSDHINGRGGVGQLTGPFADNGDLQIGEFFQAHGLQIL